MNNCYKFNISTKTLERKDHMNHPRFSHVLQKITQKIFAFGGFYQHFGPMKSAEVYDVVQNMWKNLPDMPQKGQFITCARVENQILLSSSDKD